MSFTERIQTLAQRAPKLVDRLDTEEATKNALVMPFLSALGYDVFNPDEVVPEYTADVGTKKGEKVDYAIMRGGEVVMLVECKKASVKLSGTEVSQLYRYFSVTKARIALLTNGVQYCFYSDLDEPNKMDPRPFLELDLQNLREPLVAELRKLTKDGFDLEQMLDAASELKHLSAIKAILSQQYEEPEEEFVRYFFAKAAPGRHFRSTAKEQFSALVKKALHQFVSERLADRLRSALEREDQSESPTPDEEAPGNELAPDDEDPQRDGIVTTEEELEGYHLVKAIVRDVVDPERVSYRDTKSYFGVLIDNNNRKPLCRLHFNRSQKYIGLLDAEKNETRVALSSLNAIFDHADQLRETARRYADATDPLSTDTKS